MASLKLNPGIFYLIVLLDSKALGTIVPKDQDYRCVSHWPRTTESPSGNVKYATLNHTLLE